MFSQWKGSFGGTLLQDKFIFHIVSTTRRTENVVNTIAAVHGLGTRWEDIPDWPGLRVSRAIKEVYSVTDNHSSNPTA